MKPEDTILTEEEIVRIAGWPTKTEMARYKRLASQQIKKTAESYEAERLPKPVVMGLIHPDQIERVQLAYEAEHAKLIELHNGEIQGIANKIFSELDRIYNTSSDLEIEWRYQELKRKYVGELK